MQIFWCDTQIGGFPPINTDKTHRNFENKSVIKSADFFSLEKSADFLVGGEIVWWDTSLRNVNILIVIKIINIIVIYLKEFIIDIYVRLLSWI